MVTEQGADVTASCAHIYPALAPTHILCMYLLPCSVSVAPLDKKSTRSRLARGLGLWLCFDVAFFSGHLGAVLCISLYFPAQKTLSQQGVAALRALCVCIMQTDKGSWALLLSRRRNQGLEYP